MHFLLVCIVTGSLGQIVASQEAIKNISLKAPEYILPCYRHDPDIDNCLEGTFNHLRPYLVNGLEEINVPAIDPLFIQRLIMENGHGPFKIKALFKNVTVKGPSNYTVGRIKSDLDNYILDVDLKLPEIEVSGKYEVGGTVLLFPIRSAGDFWAAFSDVNATAKIYGKEVVNKEGLKFMRIEKLNIDFDLDKSKFKIRDLINLGNLLGAAINQFLNTNGHEIIAEMKPAASRSISAHFKSFLNAAFLKVPLQVWLPDTQPS
ncbi:circadian clock-controlled protein-like [Agrilus planipennis]|uniref:Circadian clock-controlled protein-like n=1 Tax=Agrilus planipennis TaxID=224129 RepID=A0A1W4WAM3_AGRPL|nr:circadian clock-controlled protein-like [Agrilus planipennis]